MRAKYRIDFDFPDAQRHVSKISHHRIADCRAGLLVKFRDCEPIAGKALMTLRQPCVSIFINGAFDSQILSTKGTNLVDPYFKRGDTENYISYRKDTVDRTDDFICHFKENKQLQSLLEIKETLPFGENAPNVISGATLRSYRLALAATGNIRRQSAAERLPATRRASRGDEPRQRRL